jgi:hypothetical protein
VRTYIRVLLDRSQRLRVDLASKALEAVSVDVRGLLRESTGSSVDTLGGDMVLHLDDELARDQLSTTGLDDRGITGGRGGQSQREKGKESGSVHDVYLG